MSTSTFNVGFKAIRKLVEEGDTLGWHKAKVTEQLFKGVEVDVYKWVANHLSKYNSLPTKDTLFQQFPEIMGVDTPEPPKYYLDLLDRRFAYDTINQANVDSQTLLKGDKTATVEAEALLRKALDKLAEQRYRTRILNLGLEAPKLVLSEYHKINAKDAKVVFGWPYMDEMTGGAMGGDVISFVGRPAAGKTWQVLNIALKNWLAGRNILFASMEMNHLAVAQRVASMYTQTGISQLKLSQYSSEVYKKFSTKLAGMKNEQGSLYVVDGNLAAYVDDLYMLAAQMKCDAVVIDGAYLLRHRNPRLDRFTRVAENVEHMKTATTDLEIPTFASWQFNREAAKKGKGLMKGQKASMEDIGYSDAIPQVSSVVLGMSQEESVETMQYRLIDVLKGRNGEIGQFKTHWNFDQMNFDQITDSEDEDKMDAPMEYL